MRAVARVFLALRRERGLRSADQCQRRDSSISTSARAVLAAQAAKRPQASTSASAAKPTKPLAVKKQLDIIDEEEEPMYPLKMEEKKPKKRAAAKKTAPSTTQLVFADNIELNISDSIRKAVSKKPKSVNPQAEPSDPTLTQPNVLQISESTRNFNEDITKVCLASSPTRAQRLSLLTASVVAIIGAWRH